MPPLTTGQANTGSGTAGICPTPIIIVAVFVPIAVTAVGLRFYSRRLKGVPCKADDYMILPALFFALVQAVCLVLNAVYGNLGNHQPLNKNGKAIPSPELEVFQIYEYICFITFVLALGFAKLSILHLYLRIFELQNTFRVTVWIVYGFNVAWSLTFFFGYVWKCNPIPDYWMTANLTGHCLPNTFNYAFAFSNVLLDAVILVLPLPMVWSLNMSVRQKVVVSSVFLMGSFVVLLSIAKAVAFFVTFERVQVDNDIMWDEAPLFYFSVPEALFAVVSACLPTLRPLLSRMRIPLTSAVSQSRIVGTESQAGTGPVSVKRYELNGRGLPVCVSSREQHYRDQGMDKEKGLDVDRRSKATGFMWEWFTRRSPELDEKYGEASWKRESDAPMIPQNDVGSMETTVVVGEEREIENFKRERTAELKQSGAQRKKGDWVEVRLDKPLPPEPAIKYGERYCS